MKRRRKVPASVTIPIAPMIDCVFLLLVYFITTSSMKKTEADIGFELPAQGQSSTPLAVQTRQEVQVSDTGNPIVNQFSYPAFSEDRLEEFKRTIQVFRDSCLSSGEECEIIIFPVSKAPHQSITRIMDGLASLGISKISFRLE